MCEMKYTYWSLLLFSELFFYFQLNSLKRNSSGISRTRTSVTPYSADTIIIDAYPLLPHILPSSNSLSSCNPYLNLSLSPLKGHIFHSLTVHTLFTYTPHTYTHTHARTHGTMHAHHCNQNSYFHSVKGNAHQVITEITSKE